MGDWRLALALLLAPAPALAAPCDLPPLVAQAVAGHAAPWSPAHVVVAIQRRLGIDWITSIRPSGEGAGKPPEIECERRGKP